MEYEKVRIVTTVEKPGRCHPYQGIKANITREVLWVSCATSFDVPRRTLHLSLFFLQIYDLSQIIRKSPERLRLGDILQDMGPVLLKALMGHEKNKQTKKLRNVTDQREQRRLTTKCKVAPGLDTRTERGC